MILSSPFSLTLSITVYTPTGPLKLSAPIFPVTSFPSILNTLTVFLYVPTTPYFKALINPFSFLLLDEKPNSLVFSPSTSLYIGVTSISSSLSPLLTLKV